MEVPGLRGLFFSTPVSGRNFAGPNKKRTSSGPETEMLSTCIPHILRQKGLAPTQRPALHTGGQARQVPQVLRQRLARDGEAVAVQEAPVQQVLLDCRGAPDALQVLRGGAGAGCMKYGGKKKEVTDPGAVSGGTPP